MANTRNTGFPGDAAGTAASQLLTVSGSSYSQGDLIVVTGRIASGTVTATGISGGNVAWQTPILNSVNSTQGKTIFMAWGIATANGTNLPVTVTFSASVTFEFVADSFSSGLGSGTTWTATLAGNTSGGTSATTVPMPPITAPASGGVYYAYSNEANVGAVPGSAGYTWALTTTQGDVFCFTLTAAASGSTDAPTYTQSGAGLYVGGAGTFIPSAAPPITDAPETMIVVQGPRFH